MFGATDGNDATGAALHLATEWAFAIVTTTFARIATTGSGGIGFGTAAFAGGQLMVAGIISSGVGFVTNTSNGMRLSGDATAAATTFTAGTRAIPVLINGVTFYIQLHPSVA